MIAEETRRTWVLIAMGAIGGLIMLDETVVGVALPTVRRDLGMSEVAAHWVVSAYMLAFAGLAAAGGKMGDIVGFKALLLAGVSVFGLASLAAGFAEDGAVLLAARAVQGVGAAVIFPATVAMVTIAFPPDQRGMALGTLAAIGTTFLAIGPLVGGTLTDWVSWRWIFWVNVPIVALIALIVLAVWRDPPREIEPPAFDAGGLVTLVVGLGLLVFAIMQGATWGWTQPSILALLASGAAALVVFVLIERRRESPLIDVRLFGIGAFSACSFVLFSGQFGKITVVVFGALYLQDALGMNPFAAGLALLVSVAAFPVMSAPVGRLADRYGTRSLVLGGMALATAGMLWMGIAAPRGSYVWLLPGLVSWGLGMPLCYAPTLRAMANAVPVAKQGETSGIGVTSRLLGGTIGTAVGSTLSLATGSFQAVFLATAGVMFAAVIAAVFAIDRKDAEPASHPCRPTGLGGPS